jgi:hypothetical protein
MEPEMGMEMVMTTTTRSGLFLIARQFLTRLCRPAALTPEQAEAIGRGFSVPVGRR